jgi:hypothetical protein
MPELQKKVKEEETKHLSAKNEFDHQLNEILQKNKVSKEVVFSQISELYKRLSG